MLKGSDSKRICPRSFWSLANKIVSFIDLYLKMDLVEYFDLDDDPEKLKREQYYKAKGKYSNLCAPDDEWV